VLRRAHTSSAWVGTPGHALPGDARRDLAAVAGPFGKPVLEPLRVAAVAAQGRDGLVGVDAAGPAAVRHHAVVAGEDVEGGIELVERNRSCAGDVPGVVLEAGADVGDG
jgi:hypothetical protein